ncbi:MAG: SH3 domain-containing protein [Campylobacterota bacterium]
MRTKNYIFLLLGIILFTGCSKNIYISSNKEKKQITFPKTVLDELEIKIKSSNNFKKQHTLKKEFINKYFAPWRLEKVSIPKDEAKWALNYKYQEIYLQNHKKATKKWFNLQEKNSNFKDYNKLARKAITIKNSNIRALPTKQVLFKNPNQAGEGFPFDYNQNSTLKINTPIFVSHLSKDKAWAFIQTPSFAGWIDIHNIAFTTNRFIKEFKTHNYHIAIKDNFAIYENSNFKEYIKLATFFPKKNSKYLIANKNSNQEAVVSYIDIKKSNISSFPLKFSKTTTIDIAKQLFNEPYGWGGLLNKRDCSSFTKDYFAVFGKYLSRNSRAQTTNGTYIDISNLTNKEKKAFILKNAKPFQTLVYLKGHIMIYIGSKQNEPLVIHNVWGLKLHSFFKEEFRHIIGKAAITNLNPGKSLKGFNKQNSILSRVQG